MLERGGLRYSPFQPAISEKRMLHRIFKALADPTRLRTLNLLIKAPLCVCDLGCVLQRPQSLISCHLAYLKNAGLVDDHRQGMRVQYSISLSAENQTGTR